MIRLEIDEFIADYKEDDLLYKGAIFRRDIYSSGLIMVYKDFSDTIDCIRLEQLEVFKLLNKGSITNIKLI